MPYSIAACTFWKHYATCYISPATNVSCGLPDKFWQTHNASFSDLHQHSFTVNKIHLSGYFNIRDIAWIFQKDNQLFSSFASQIVFTATRGPSTGKYNNFPIILILHLTISIKKTENLYFHHHHHHHSSYYYYYSFIHSFKIFLHLWLAKNPHVIHHNQLLSTKFGRRFCDMWKMTLIGLVH